MNLPVTDNAKIIPVAGGKGGVGKSLFTANIAVALARMGNPTTVIDLDLGSSNLHTFLNVPNKYPGVGDFLKARKLNLSDLQIPTSFPNLNIITGDGLSPHMANITYGEKIKLIKAIKRLDAKYILLDLSAGSTFNTLDFFSIASSGILVTRSEMPAMMNLLNFLKNYVFRLIEKEVRKIPGIHNSIRDIFRKSITEGSLKVDDIINQVASEDVSVAEKIRGVIGKVQPRLILNMGKNPEELSWLKKMEENVSNNLSIHLDHFGFLPSDSVAMESVAESKPVVAGYPESYLGIAIHRIADRIVRLWSEKTINNSWDRLYKDSKAVVGS